MGFTLYELTEDFLKLLELAEEPDVDEKTLADTMEGIEGEFEAKADAYAVIIKQLQNDADALGKEIERLKDRKARLENNAKYMKKRLQESMTITGNTHFNTEKFNFNVRKNGGLLPVIINVGVTVDDLPEDCIKVKTEKKPDMEKIRKMIDEGNVAFAHYGERGENLIIT